MTRLDYDKQFSLFCRSLKILFVGNGNKQLLRIL